MDLRDILSQNAIVHTLDATSKKQVLQALAEKAAELTDLSVREVFDTVLQREKLGSTGVGSGVAIPHGKFTSIDGIFGIFARLEKPVDFDAPDDQPVDLVFLLLAPESAGADHLKALSRVARLFRDRVRLQALRQAATADDIAAIIFDEPEANAA